ncbi:MAG: DUF6252 family protein [Ferruginibacter sp.]
MKKIFFTGLILSSLFVFYSCQKELSYNPGTSGTGTGGGTTPPASTGTFKAKIDGVQWEANVIKTASIQAGVIAVYGYSSDRKNMILRVADSGVHNYTFNVNSASNAGAYTDSAVNNFAFVTNQWSDNADHGTMNVTKIDVVNKLISGTFTMDVKQAISGLSRNITEGVFTDISYATTLPPPSSTDTFRVKVDGVDFNYSVLFGYSGLGTISISASGASGNPPTVAVTVPSVVVPGNYAFDLINYSGQYNTSSTTFLGADTGHVQIIEHDIANKRIRGNFNFRAAPLFGTGTTPNFQLTQGYFSVKYL